MTKTILYYTDCKYFGGAEEYLATIFREIDRSLWRPILIYHPSSENRAFTETVQELNIDIVSIPEIRSVFDFKALWVLITKIKKIKPSIFHANLSWPLACTYGIICAALSGVKITVATQHLFLDSIGPRKRIAQKFISRFVNCYITVSKTISENMKTTIRQNLVTKVIHNGIVLRDLDGKAAEGLNFGALKHLRDQKKLPVVLTVARLHKQKGHAFLLEASKLIPGAIFVFAGDGPERNYLENYSKELNVQERVVFLGYRNDIPSLISECDIFVLPSLFEGLPLTILEAMAAGKPVVASDIPGVDEEVVNNVTGFLVPKENPEALALAINSLLSNPKMASEFGDAAKHRAQKEFSSEKMVESITDLYKEILNLA